MIRQTTMMSKKIFIGVCLLLNFCTQAAGLVQAESLYPPLDPKPVQELLYQALKTIKEQPHKINDINETGYTFLQQALIDNAHIENYISELEDANGTEQDILNTNLVTIKILLNNGADPNIPFPKTNVHSKAEHFLMKAVQYNGLRFPLHIISLLFKHGLSVEVRGQNDETALMKLILLRYVWRYRKLSEYRKEFIKIVVKNTIDFNVQDDKGNTALHHTSRLVDLETARLILQNPVQIDIKNNQGQTPKQMAQSLSSAVLPGSADLRWYWHFSFLGIHHKMIRLLEAAERRQLPASSKKMHPAAALCKKAFSSIRIFR